MISLRIIRNALIHRFVKIKMLLDKENEENMTEGTLVERTLELARLVRNAFIYLLHFVFIEENKEEAKLGKKMLPMFAFELPDKLKSYR